MDKIKDYDLCVICGKVSPYTKDTHIDLRIGYIEGGGQACFIPNKCQETQIELIKINPIK